MLSEFRCWSSFPKAKTLQDEVNASSVSSVSARSWWSIREEVRSSGSLSHCFCGNDLWNRITEEVIMWPRLPPRCLSAPSLANRQDLSLSLPADNTVKVRGHGSQLCDKRRTPNWRKTDYIPEEECDEALSSIRAACSHLLQHSVSFSPHLSRLS